MIEIIIRKNGVDLAKVESNEVQIIRCIKRNRTGEVPESGWLPISDVDIVSYAAAPILPIGESWKQQMQAEDEQIIVEEMRLTPDDKIGALERASVRIAELNDPTK